MLVTRDIYTQYRYAYPVEGRGFEEVINIRFPLSQSIGYYWHIAYTGTDNGRAFIKAFEELQVDHQTSIEYLDSTKSLNVKQEFSLKAPGLILTKLGWRSPCGLLQRDTTQWH